MFPLAKPVNPLMDSLLDSFFECKKLQVKQRLRDSMESIVDDLFGEFIDQIKLMMTGGHETGDEMTPSVVETPVQMTPKAKSSPILVAKKSVPTKPKPPKSNHQIVAVKSVPSTSNQSSGGRKRPNESVANSNDDSTSAKDLVIDLEDTGNIDGSSIPHKKPKVDHDEEPVDLGGDQQDNDSEQRDSSDQGKFLCRTPGCGKRFPKSYNLHIHERTHSGAKPFICKYPGCSFANGNRPNALSHIRNKHLKNSPEESKDPKEYLEVNQELLK